MESYKVLVLSTAHLTKRDSLELAELASAGNLRYDSMVLEREFGFFVKLYEPPKGGDEDMNGRDELSPDFKRIIDYAVAHGYRMVEFDRDGDIVDIFPSHEW